MPQLTIEVCVQENMAGIRSQPMNFAIVILEVGTLSISSNEAIGRIPFSIQRIFYAILKTNAGRNREQKIGNAHFIPCYHDEDLRPKSVKSHARWTEKRN